MDTPPIASIKLLLRLSTVKLGQRPLISLPMALPVPSPSLLWDKSENNEVIITGDTHKINYNYK